MSQLATSINRMVASGGTVFAASGDNGAYDCARPLVPDGHLAVDFPASLPSVVAVGGTSLTRDGSGAFSETGWGPAPTTTSGTTYAGRGSGGGTSAVFARPAYQSSISAGGTGRAVPDVSALGDAKTGFGAYSSSAGGWHLFGGTSFGAPMWAGQLASALAAGGLSSGLGDIHAALYAAPSAFRDVTSGANGFYTAGAGYDLVTGLGSPQWASLYIALGLRLPVITSVDAGGTVTSPSGEPVVATVTSPVAGTVSFLPLTRPRPPALTASLSQGLRITGPGAPLTLAFTLKMSLLPAGALPSEVRAFHNGSVVPACTSGAGECLASSSQATDGLHLTITGASSGEWTFAVDRVVRLASADRVGTAVAVSRAAFAAGSAPVAVLARADQYADALAGAPLAAAKKGPLLLTGSSALAAADAVELTRAVPPGGTVYLLGGPAALSPSVADQVTALGFTVVRLAGTDRFATATAIATALAPTGPILLTTGLSFPDALAAGAAAAHVGAAVLLTSGGTKASATQVFLAAHPNATLYAVGGPAALAYPQAIALVGIDRYATAVLVAKRFFPGSRGAGLASGVSFPDALAAGPVLGAIGVPLLLTGTTTLASVTGGYLTAAKPLTVHMFGGTGALGAGVTTAVWSTLG
jgi:putative cell wall-binding protein